jgi:carnitine 3-dehydrogenase
LTDTASRPEPSAVRTVACIGVGTIGGGWTAYFLAQGLDVRAYDPNPRTCESLRQSVELAWPFLERLGLAQGASIDRLTICGSVAEAVRGAEFVQESVIEDKELKIELFGELGDLTSDEVILATSSSRFIPSDIAVRCRAPGRVIVAHPFAPTYLIPLVELLGNPETPAEVMDWSQAFFTAIGKVPVVLKKEIELFIGNRLQSGYVDEARRLVEGGYCTYEDIDNVIVNSFGIRLAFMGLSHYYHLGGGKGGLEHMFKLFGWQGNAHSQESLRKAVKRLTDVADTTELERWRDDNIVRILQARRLEPGS